MMLRENEVLLLWLPTEPIGEADWPKLRRLLDEAERARADRFHFERDRQVYTAAHALLRGTLSELTGRAPQDWRFEVGEHGKPEAIRRPGEPPLRVNISHTRGLAAVAVTLGREVGVDVEWLERDNAILNIAGRYFAPAECAYLLSRPAAEATDTFFAFWTLKEAYIKAVGKGLSLPLDAFAFTLDPLAVSFVPPIEDDPASWQFQRFRPGPAHVAALGVRQPAEAPLEVTARPAGLDALLALAG
ncbi:4'-phosphopantetheinyl transferase [Tistlia consotensis]|uniref:4'-phosphopantetheinyl transferase n=1 Tax=Tistlia consotensis USBA 355 TaxID=560819 RepID=A0A1Y6CUU4_9PROT|nr:4'-phosphopantetheinyl transferase superfamily protein [Tistlia consotensis]SMF81025.1 4'-phosphopantetheinyl transferase [Tistlia consotensis USBA 355]SNS22391.1 4'-phosphopantetheinyl transferase [Tistlia consotensis]